MDQKPVILMSLLLVSGCTDVYIQEETEKDITITKAEEVFIIYFYTEDCDHCHEVETWLEELQGEYGSKVSVRYVDVLTREGWEEFKGHGFSITPAVVINEEITLQFTEMTKESLSELIEKILDLEPLKPDTCQGYCG